jgi:hypothetical protein
MQEKQLFEYAVVRVVPKVEREEFLNVGIILYCRQSKFLQCRYKLDKARLTSFCPSLDINEVEGHLRSFERICNGSLDGGPIARLDTASRFRWLSATRSTIVQTSKVHPGLSVDAKETLQRLYEQLVL